MSSLPPNPSMIPYCLMNKPLGIRNPRMSALEWILECDSVVAKLWSLGQCQKFAPILNGKRKIKTIKWAFHKNQMYPFKKVFEIIFLFLKYPLFYEVMVLDDSFLFVCFSECPFLVKWCWQPFVASWPPLFKIELIREAPKSGSHSFHKWKNEERRIYLPKVILIVAILDHKSSGELQLFIIIFKVLCIEAPVCLCIFIVRVP